MTGVAEAESPVELHRHAFLQLREQLVRILGVQTVDLIIERGAAEISPAFPAMGLLRFEKSEVNLDAVVAALDGKSEPEVRPAFDALNGVILLVLARLLGKENALRMADGEGTRSLLRGLPFLGGP
jgi:hypothetical protein